MQKSDINILIVEDDNSLREALCKAFDKLGYKSIPVKKADEAESLARIKPIHAAVVDCMLPGKNGVDLVVKIRENMFESAPVIFVSGIYRDRSFHQEAIKKAQAIEFLLKPYDLSHITDSIEKNLAHLVDAPKLDLHALLAAPMASHRERRKALDHVEEMKGYDLPFVFCILLESESSGYLNIVDQDQNIYGVTFAKGAIQKVDSEATVMITRQTLVKHGFITEEEISQVKEKQPLELMNSLVKHGFLSPHVPVMVHCEQVFTEISKLIGPQPLKTNFVIDRKIKPSENDVSYSEFKHRLFSFIDKYVTAEYLKDFYSTWSGHPIRLGPNYKSDISIFDHPMFSKLKDLTQVLAKEGTIEELMAQSGYKEEDLLKALHILAIRRLVVFNENKRVYNLDEHVARLKSLHSDLKGKDIFEIFNYLGVEAGHKVQSVTKIYKDFAKSNHPDTLPQAISDEVRKLNHEVFSWITDAYETLTDEKKRENYIKEVKQKDAEKQLRSEDLLHEAQTYIQKGKVTTAKEKVDAALNLYRSDKGVLCSMWVAFKSNADGKSLEADELESFSVELKKMPIHSRKTPLFYFVNALVKKGQGNLIEAKAELEKALQTDGDFMDARRELVSLKAGEPQKMSVNDLLNADLGTVIGKLFKGKKGA